MHSLMIQNDSEVLLHQKEVTQLEMCHLLFFYLIFKLCGTVELKRRNSREIEPCLLPTTAGWAPASSCPEPREQAVDAPAAPGSPRAGREHCPGLTRQDFFCIDRVPSDRPLDPAEPQCWQSLSAVWGFEKIICLKVGTWPTVKPCYCRL